MKKTISLLLSVFLIFSAASCSTSGSKNGHMYGSDLKGKDGSGLYTMEKVSLPDSNISIIAASGYGRDIFMLGSVSFEAGYIFYKLNMDTLDISVIDYTTQDNIAYAHGIQASPRGGCMFMIANPIDGTQDLKYTIREIDTNGKIVAEYFLDNLKEYDHTAVTGFLPTEKGTLICMFNKSMLVDESGNVIKVYDNLKTNKKAVRSADGLILLCGMVNDKYVVEELSEAFKSSIKYELNAQYSDVYSGFDGAEVFLSDGSNIYSVDYKTGNRIATANFMASNINPYDFIAISDDSFFTLQKYVPVIWSRQSAEEAAELVILKLATFDINPFLRTAIGNFNSQSTTYKIDVTDYSSYNTGDGSTAGLLKLNTEIIAGALPDIFDISLLPGDIYKSKGLLEELKPFIDSDTNFEYGDFVPSIMDTLSQNGGLYDFVPGFRLNTMVGSSDIIGSIKNLTPEKFLSIADDANKNGKSVLPEYTTREDFIEFILAFMSKDYMNKASGICNFDNSSFSSLLEFAATLPSAAEMDASTIQVLQSMESSKLLSGKQVFKIIETGFPIDEFLINRGLFGEKGVYTGFPVNSGSGCAITPFVQLGMSAKSEHKDAIWEFFRYLISDECQREIFNHYQVLPIITKSLDESLKERANSFKENGLRLSVYDGQSETLVDCGFPNEQMFADIQNVISKIDRLNEYDTIVYDIIIEEAAAYFAGAKTVDETVSLIQNRVSLYVAEQSN